MGIFFQITFYEIKNLARCTHLCDSLTYNQKRLFPNVEVKRAFNK